MDADDEDDDSAGAFGVGSGTRIGFTEETEDEADEGIAGGAGRFGFEGEDVGGGDACLGIRMGLVLTAEDDAIDGREDADSEELESSDEGEESCDASEAPDAELLEEGSEEITICIGATACNEIGMLVVTFAWNRTCEFVKMVTQANVSAIAKSGTAMRSCFSKKSMHCLYLCLMFI